MKLVRWSPITDMFSLSHRMNHMFDDFLSPELKTGESYMWNWDPIVDYYDNEENIVIKTELPGIDKDNIPKPEEHKPRQISVH